MSLLVLSVFFFKQKTAYELRISDWSSDVCSSDLQHRHPAAEHQLLGENHDQDCGANDEADRGDRELRLPVELVKASFPPVPAQAEQRKRKGQTHVDAVENDQQANRATRHQQDRKSTRLNSSH